MRRQSDDDDLSRVIAGAIGFYCRGGEQWNARGGEESFSAVKEFAFQKFVAFISEGDSRKGAHTHAPTQGREPSKTGSNWRIVCSVRGEFLCNY